MLIEAMWKVEERQGCSEALAVAARFDHDVARRAAQVLAERWITQHRVFRRPTRASFPEEIDAGAYSSHHGKTPGSLSVPDVARTVLAQAKRWEAEGAQRTGEPAG